MRRLLLVVALTLTACSEKRPPLEPRSTPAAAPPAAAPTDAVEEGTFRITAAGKPVGEETFRSLSDGTRREVTTRTVVRRGEQEVIVEGTLYTDAKFVPQSGRFSHAGKDGKKLEQTLERKDGVLQLSAAGSEPIVETQPSDLFVDNLVVSHLEPLCVLARDDERELRMFPGPKLVLSGRHALEFQTKAGAKALDIVAFRVPGGAEVEILCDGSKLVMVRQASVAVVTTRAGYQEVVELIAAAEDHKPKLAAGLVELERQVRSDAAGGAVLACSLVLPSERRSPLAAVVLIGAQGPQDRDEDTLGAWGLKTALLKNLAIALGQSGIASLRCDDRGVGQSSGTLANAVLGSLATDVAAQVAALRAEPGIDGERVGLLGHAEGVTLAELVAADDPAIKAVAMLAGMARTLDEVSLEQRDAAMRKLGVKEVVIRDEHKRMAQVYAAIRAGKPPPKETPEETVAMLAPLVPYLASHFRFDPAFTARKVKAAVLIAHGGRDDQIPVAEAKRLRDLLARGGNRKLTLKVYPDLNHMFTAVKTGDAEDFADPELAVDLAFVGDVVTFLRASL